MKKTLFNEWYEKCGRGFAEMTFPIDSIELNEKEVRARAKTIYNSVYDSVMDKVYDCVTEIEDECYEEVLRIKEGITERKGFIKFLTDKRTDVKKTLTLLYDSYYAEKTPKEIFDSTSKILGEELSGIKKQIKEAEYEIRGLKLRLKSFEFFISNYCKYCNDDCENCHHCDCDCD